MKPLGLLALLFVPVAALGQVTVEQAWVRATPPGAKVDAVSYRRYQLLEDALFRDGFEDPTPPGRRP